MDIFLLSEWMVWGTPQSTSIHCNVGKYWDCRRIRYTQSRPERKNEYFVQHVKPRTEGMDEKNVSRHAVLLIRRCFYSGRRDNR